LTALGGLSVSFGFGDTLALAIFLFPGVPSFFASDFFLAGFALGVALGDFPVFAIAVASGVSLGFGFAFGASSSFSEGLCFGDFAFGVTDGDGLFCAFVLAFALLRLGVGLGDSSADGDESLCA